MDFLPKKYIIDEIYILDYRLGLNTSLQSDEKQQSSITFTQNEVNTEYQIRF